jgi:hypothetical protein
MHCITAKTKHEWEKRNSMCTLNQSLSAWKGRTKRMEHNKQFVSADAAVINGELKGGKTQQS